MPNLKEGNKNKLVKPELDIFLPADMSFFSFFKNKNIKVNSHTSKDTTIKRKVDFHLNIIKKVDEIIAGYEKQIEPETKTSLSEIIEERQPFSKKPERSSHNTNLSPEIVTFEVVPEHNGPMNVFVEKTSSMDLNDQKLAMNSTSKTAQPKTEKVKQKPIDSSNQLLNLREQNKKLKEEEKQLQKEEKTMKKEEKILEKEVKEGKIKLKKAAQQKREEEKRLKIQKNLKAKAELAEQKEKKKQEKIKERELKKKAIEQEKQEKIEAATEIKQQKEKEQLIIIEEKKKEKVSLDKKKEAERLKRLELEKSAEDALIKERGLALKFKEKEKQKKLKAKMALAEQKERERLKKLEDKKKQKAKSKAEKKTSKISKEEPKINIKHNINLKENTSEVLSMDEDVIKFLKIADDLLEKLPDNVIDEFAKSKDFEIYERVINKYKK